MWNLLRNLPYGAGFRAGPCFDSVSHPRTQYLNSGYGEPYSKNRVYRLVLTGQAPFEACARYSDELRGLVKDCLMYNPDARRTLDDLRQSIQNHMSNKNLKTAATGNLWIFSPKDLTTIRVGAEYRGPRRNRPTS